MSTSTTFSRSRKITRAHNPDLDGSADGIDVAAIGRLIYACLALGRQ